ncbi:Hypothetical protein D9617_2g052950 [Elsinoe fawcettii]|nr:Hypothetical protein D9617_2g052950 [Elsinoe fawcettii]
MFAATSTTDASTVMTVYRGWDDPGHYVWSQFVTKLEARLRFAGIKYRTEAGSVRKSPRGKLPYVSIPSTGPGEPTVLSDTTLIISNRVKLGDLENLNARLSAPEKAHDLAIRALLEDKLVFYQLHERWHQNYYTMRGHILSGMPYVIQVPLGLLVYRRNMRTLYGQGAGRFSAEEIAAFRLEIWDSLEALLTTSKKAQSNKVIRQPFWILGGPRPTEADAVLFGFLASNLHCTAAPDSQKVIRGKPVVMVYARRIHDTYFPDYQVWQD